MQEIALYLFPMRRFLSFLLCFAALAAGVFALNEDQPPRETRLVEKKLEQLADQDTESLGVKALAIAPTKWKHAETENFFVHYRRVTEAQRVVREIEYDLWCIARTLGAPRDRYRSKSHVYIFQDEKEWKQFSTSIGKESWVASFAHGDRLFLHVGGIGEGFDSHLLAHETTHAVVARLYPNSRWPLWLSEGFAEYMGGASVASRKKQFIKSFERDLQKADRPLKELTALTTYPEDHEQVHRLYQSSEKVVRFLMTEFPKDRVPKFAEAMVEGQPLDSAVTAVYGDQVKDFDAFEKKYARFVK